MRVLNNLLSTAAIVVLCGCDQQQANHSPENISPTTNTATVPQVLNQASNAAMAVAVQAQKVVAENTTAAQKAVSNVTVVTQAAIDDVTARGQSLIEQAQKHLASNNYQGAMDILQQLANIKLTAEQQKLADSLKAQVQAALAKTALGSALEGKRFNLTPSKPNTTNSN